MEMGRVIQRISFFAACVALALLFYGCASFSRHRAAAEPGAAATAARSPSSASVEQHGFTVRDFRAVRDGYEKVSVVGEITNTGTAARGVELQATLRNAAGRVLAVGHFCPASYRNIKPGETWPFAYSFGYEPDAAQAELRIVGAFRTMDIYNVAPTVIE
jgi:hypothetical protein